MKERLMKRRNTDMLQVGTFKGIDMNSPDLKVKQYNGKTNGRTYEFDT